MQAPANPKVKAAVRYYALNDGAYHVYDPTTQRHFKMGAQEVGWLKLLDGTKPHAELVGRIPLEYFEDFFRNLDRMALLEGGAAPKERFNLLKIKLFWVDPSRVLNALAPVAGAYRVTLNVVTWPVAFLNICVFAAILQGVPGLLPSAPAMLGHIHFGLLAIALYLLAIAITGAVHEMSHGLVATSYGVAVPAFGFMLLILNPAFYADVSGINHLTERKQRLQILSAGVKANNVMMLVGMFAYVFARETPFAPYLLLFAFINFGLCLINLIPFVAYDGYYIFQELMGEARYSTRAFAAVFAGGERRTDYVLYTLISIALRFSLVFLVINRLRLFVKGHWSSIYVDVAALVLFVLTWAFVIRSSLQPRPGRRA